MAKSLIYCLIIMVPFMVCFLSCDVKRICETDIGLVSQCCLAKCVFRMSKQYLADVALKINVKVGGRNTVFVDALRFQPSIAVVVASRDWPEVTKYAGLVCAQPHHQELIQDLFKVWQDPWITSTGQKPQRIIFYRDGVSEGQFYQVLLYELDAIRKACASLEWNYQPPSGNILAGLLLILRSATLRSLTSTCAAMPASNRPAHYHILWDENNFTANALRMVTNNLCYPYARCTRSVSISSHPSLSFTS
ncbi:unnamed protein product [Musa acuminata subsp. malaccensis]|uniref:(wild Malaysian banana) hypothetical protein n=1 Tax=Musa acuminata subsp. malaccensis TaxID=214687 RepID=A0A804JS06_MUSAM|nr:unnamed protein product [Musa acuminata subsp. malaccensis]